MNTNKSTARIAGLLYLVVVVTGIFNLAYVPSKLMVAGDAAATVENIRANQMLFRLGMFSGLVCYIAFLFLPLVLYKLLKPVNQTHAVLMAVLAIVSVPVSFINMVNKFTVLNLISGAEYLKAFDAAQLQAQIMLSLNAYSAGNQVTAIFWGLWLFPFGYLVFKSGILPKVFGVLLMFGCFGYLIDFTGGFLFAGYNDTAFAAYVMRPGTLGEIGICLWLLIMGAKDKEIAGAAEAV